jgi:predicted Zn-dependent protease with MMP-like domain
VSNESWRNSVAPSLEEFETMATTAYAGLPERFRELCEGIVIHVSDFPDEEVIADMALESPFDILGLFTGIGMSQDGAVPETGRLPNSIHIYRRPILDYWAEHNESLGAIITHVLVHEIGHHFGLSDEDMERIEAAAEELRAADAP